MTPGRRAVLNGDTPPLILRIVAAGSPSGSPKRAERDALLGVW